ncbi:MAG: DNA-directed RNA polymerase subunit omega [Dialister sp.]|nr:DNA-directed RNA polymerase subunit omega [Dialister sp.]
MMLEPAMKDLLKQVPSRYELVNVVACKARKIAREAEMAGEPLEEKPVSIAIQAVARGELDKKPEETEQVEA